MSAPQVRRVIRTTLGALLPTALLAPNVWAQSGKPVTDEAAVMATAKTLQAKVLSIDTHVDISPANFTESGPNYTTKLPRTQVDLVKMEEGGLASAFLIVYVGQAATLDEASFARANQQAIEKFQAIHTLTERLAPNRAEIAYTAADARRIHAAGKRVIFIGVENGFPIGSDITNVKKFYDLGGRYMSLAHNGHSQLSDSNTGERDGVWLHNGLSPLGKQVIAEMNKLGMMIDVSHPSKASMMQTVALSKAPIIGSHSGVRALCNHSRNMDDEQIDAMKKNGGVIQLVAFNSYVKCDPKRDVPREQARAAANEELRKQYGITATSRQEQQAQIQALPNDKRNAYLAAQEDITARRYPSDPPATVKDFVNHIDYVVKRIGIDHVGISSDFDGGGGVDGWRNAGETINVTAELVRRGYTAAEIEKIWGGNLLRVLAQVEKVAGKK
ncbi:MAG: dipeptidase [Gemmatimonadaceae bacterium]|nr:dipeptidase [Gemmatimonadaceae bacterium]